MSNPVKQIAQALDGLENSLVQALDTVKKQVQAENPPFGMIWTPYAVLQAMADELNLDENFEPTDEETTDADMEQSWRI